MGEDCDWVGTLLLQRPGLCIKQRHAGGKTHGTGDTAMEALTWMCVSRECGLSPLYLSFVLFLFLSLLPHFKREVLHPCSTPSCFPWNHSSVTRSLPSYANQLSRRTSHNEFLVFFDAFVSNEAWSKSWGAFKHVLATVCFIPVWSWPESHSHRSAPLKTLMDSWIYNSPFSLRALEAILYLTKLIPQTKKKLNPMHSKPL